MASRLEIPLWNVERRYDDGNRQAESGPTCERTGVRNLRRKMSFLESFLPQIDGHLIVLMRLRSLRGRGDGQRCHTDADPPGQDGNSALLDVRNGRRGDGLVEESKVFMSEAKN
jgi:hypothetical protein